MISKDLATTTRGNTPKVSDKTSITVHDPCVIIQGPSIRTRGNTPTVIEKTSITGIEPYRMNIGPSRTISVWSARIVCNG